MASVKKRRDGFAVVYYYTNDAGERKQRWEQYSSYSEAHKRRAEIEYKQNKGDFIAPSKQTIAVFMEDFVSLYGPKKWGTSVYEANTASIANYIIPIIGDMCVQDVSTRAVDLYIHKLQKTKPVEQNGRKAKDEFLPPASIEKIIKLLRCTFKQAVRWGIVPKNPFDNAVLPKVERVRREIWNAEMIKTAFDQCTDAKLYLAMNLSFACSMRLGEILGLTWNNVHISDADIATDNAYVYIEKSFRVSQGKLWRSWVMRVSSRCFRLSCQPVHRRVSFSKIQKRNPAYARFGCRKPWHTFYESGKKPKFLAND